MPVARQVADHKGRYMGPGLSRPRPASLYRIRPKRPRRVRLRCHASHDGAGIRRPLERLMPALDLALGLRVEGRAADMTHAPIREPIRQVAGDVTRSVVAQQPGSMRDLGAIAA